MSEFLGQPAAKSEDMETKKLTENVDIWIHDMEADGVVIDIDNRDAIVMHVRFNFAESENLVLQVAEGITKVDEHRCGFDVPPKTLKRVIHLDVENIDLGSYDLRYKVEGFVRNDKGELVDATKHKGSAADLVAGKQDGGSAGGSSSSASAQPPAATSATTVSPAGGEASGTITKAGKGGAGGNESSSGGGANAADEGPSPFEACEDEPEIEEKKVNDNVTLVLYHFEGYGYEFRVRTTDSCPATILSLDCSQSDNLATAPLSPSTADGEGKLKVRLPGGADEVPICRLTMKDEEEEGYGMAYKVSSKVDTSAQGGNASGEIDIKKKKADEEAAAAKKKADDEAAAAAKKAADEAAAAKKKAEEEEADNRAKEARAAGELARKKKEEDDKKKAEDAAAKKKEDEAKRKTDAAEKDKMRAQMMEKAKKEAEDQQKREEEKKAKKEAYDGERKRVADEHAAKEETLYGEMLKKKMTPFEEREVKEAEAAADLEAEDFAKDIVKANPAAATLKPEYRKVWKLYAFYKRRYEIEWRLRFMLIEKMFWERVCSLCRDFMPQGSEIKQYKTHKVHPECYDKAPKCDMCGEILIGNYVMTKGDTPTRLHNECVIAYKNKSRPDCKKCGKKILEDKWTTKAGEHYHNACGV